MNANLIKLKVRNIIAFAGINILQTEDSDKDIQTIEISANLIHDIYVENIRELIEAYENLIVANVEYHINAENKRKIKELANKLMECSKIVNTLSSELGV